MLSRTILGQPVVLFRTAEQKIAVLLDQCPHKLAPLSMGDCKDGRIRCGYHGLEFDGSGVCTHAPGQKRIPPNARVRVFPSIERYGLVFVWTGDPDNVCEDRIPVIDRFGVPGWNAIADGYQLHETNYLNIVENLMDPAHTTFVHKQTIANPLAEDVPVEVAMEDDYVVAYRWIENTRPSPYDRKAKVVEFDAVDRGQYFYFYPPSVSRVDICITEAGKEKTEENLDKGTRTLSYKFLTPETDRTTHLFWIHLRNYRLGDTNFENVLRKNLEKTFWEDNDMCAAVQCAQDRTGERQQTYLAIDKGPRLALQMIERRLREESRSAQHA